MSHTSNKCPTCKQWYIVEVEELAGYVNCPPCRAKKLVTNLKQKITDELVQETFRKYDNVNTEDRSDSSN